MSRAEKLLTVLLIIFVAITLALVALLFAYHFVRTEGTGITLAAEAAEPAPEEYAAEEAYYEAVLANVGASLADALTPEAEPTRAEATQPAERVDAYTRIVFERNYVLDGITLTAEEPIPHFAINMDRESLSTVYAEWDIIDFTPRQVTMRRNITNRHAEHYIVSEYNGFVAVFLRSGGAEPALVEVTRAPLSSLSPGEQSRIRTGIVVHGEDALLRIIQDYES